MTLDDLITALTQLREGHEGYTVYIQKVDDGVTYAQDFGVSVGDPADGEVIWLFPTTEHAPAWLV